MSKYITEFNQTGNSTLNIDLVCKDWNDRFLISTWINDSEEKFTFIIKGKIKNRLLLKTQISKQQAFAIADRLKLRHIKNGIFSSGGAFYSESFINSEIQRLMAIKQEKTEELKTISNMLSQYENRI